MAVTIRLTKTGRTGEKKYRIVVKEKRSDRDGRAIETLGWYERNGKVETKQINQDRVKYWISVGARPSAAVEKIIK